MISASRARAALVTPSTPLKLPHMSTALKLGLIVGLTDDVESRFKALADLGLETCQLCCWEPDIMTAELAAKVREASRTTGIEVSTFWAGHTGRTVWNFLEGPATIGLVPEATRSARLAELKIGSDFAAMIAAPSMATHVGFIDENPNSRGYGELIPVLTELARQCADQGHDFLFETGQETPVTLLRAIEDIGTSNLGINLDPANLILYGKANPIDALEVIGSYVRGVHAKDGLYPTNGRELGKEVPLGEGKVDFPRLIRGLRDLGYRWPITIEREIAGPQQTVDIKQAIDVLRPLVAEA